MKNGKMNRCRLCGAFDTNMVFDGPMRRSGCKERSDTGHRVYTCNECGIEHIHPFPGETGCDYSDGTYWQEQKGGAEGFGLIYAKALDEALLWLNKIGAEAFRGKRVLDFGCGTGAFLDLVKGLASETIGIEADSNLVEMVRAKGHRTFLSVEAALEANIHADMICTFDVLEHVTSPILFLKRLGDLLVGGGRLCTGVPNQRDLIKKIVPEYLGHFYHVEHLWYFSSESLEYCLREAGYNDYVVKYLHKYNLMNLVEWAKNGVPPGIPGSDVIDKEMDSSFISWAEDRGIASHILIETTKTEN